MQNLIYVLVLLLTSILVSACSSLQEESKSAPLIDPSAPGLPNIVLIVSDDQGYADLGATGLADDVRTPNLDRLAAMGTRFTQAYNTSPICNPSRAGLITGAYQQRFGVLWYGGEGLRDDAYLTIAEILKSRGYRTGYFGKFHYGSAEYSGPDSRNFPLNHGFDELFGFEGGRKHYLLHDRQSQAAFEEGLAREPTSSGHPGLQMQPFWVNFDRVDQSGFSTDLIGQASRRFISQRRSEPFFAQIAFNAVHNFTHQLPAQVLVDRGLTGYPGDWNPAREEYLEWYRRGRFPNNPEGREQYLVQLELMDQEIGRILDSVEQLASSRDTIFVFLSDNGGSTPIYANNGPLRGSKYTLYEGGVRVQMIIASPGRFRQRYVASNLVSAMDILPTLATVAGATVPPSTDGIDLSPILIGTGDDLGHEFLVWDTGSEKAVRWGKWKYRSGGDLANAQREMVEMEIGEFLYDLEADPGERVNLVENRPDILEKLSAIHEGWREEIGGD